MTRHQLGDFSRGWFIGNFEPTLVKIADFEVAIKKYKSGDKENRHYHNVAREFTAVIDGVFKMNDMIVKAGDIIEIAPSEGVAFECLEDGSNVVVKIPSLKGDKYE